MNFCGIYSRVSNDTGADFDLDHEISNFVEKQEQLIKEVNEITYNNNQSKAILKAMLAEIVECI